MAAERRPSAQERKANMGETLVKALRNPKVNKTEVAGKIETEKL